jgi:hypothetical protein
LKTVLKYYETHPFKTILLAGLFFRLLAAFFSKGYGWSDDQFLTIEIAKSWINGADYYHWLPSADGLAQPQGFSFFYPGLLYFILGLLKWAGIDNPQTEMTIVRLVHAVWSMGTVWFGYKIARKVGNVKTANLTGWLLALFWIFPFLSVRNLVEFVSIPFLMWGLWLILKNEKRADIPLAFWAGFLFGLAFDTRYQTALVSGTIGVVLMFQKRWKEVLWIISGGIVSVLLVQGVVDYLIWGKPFAQVFGYISYNATHAGEYTVGPWYLFVIFLLGILIPPVSFFIFAGFFKEWRRLALIFFPVLVFILFHSYYPNKQERFIVTIIPLLIIIGIAGWQNIAAGLKHQKLISGSWVFFWIVNIILLIGISVTYSKKARVESMVYLSQYADRFNYFVIDDIDKNVLGFPPRFYLGKYPDYYAIMQNNGGYRAFYNEMKNHPSKDVGFVLFYNDNDLNTRVDSDKKVFPEIVFEKKIEPGNVDKILFWLNPVNDNQNIYIYRNKAVVNDE